MPSEFQGTRMPDDAGPRRDWPFGAYGRIGGEWYVKTPNGNGGRLGQHEVVEHDDGTITVTPSILCHAYVNAPEWHGWLERGVWRDA